MKMALARQDDVVGVAPESAQQLEILGARHGAPQLELPHHSRSTCYSRGARSCLGGSAAVQAGALKRSTLFRDPPSDLAGPTERQPTFRARSSAGCAMKFALSAGR